MKSGETVLNASIPKYTIDSAVKITVIHNTDSPSEGISLDNTLNNTQNDTPGNKNSDSGGSNSSGKTLPLPPRNEPGTTGGTSTTTLRPATIQQALDLLIDGSISKETKLLSIPNIMDRYFDKNAAIRTIGSTGLILESENPEDFLRRLALSNTKNRISIIEIIKSENDKKIIELRIKENHE